jgi:ribose transport system substrate-binding protein
VAALAVVPVALLASACSSSSTASTSVPSTSHAASHVVGHYTIGFSNPEGTQPVLDTFQQALTSAAHREGLTVTSLNAALSVSNQVSDIQQFIDDKVRAIVVFPLAGPPLVPVLTAARKAGIIVLGYNAVTTDVTSASAIYPYDADLNQGIIGEGAKLAAAFVDKALHGHGNVLGVGIAAPVPSLHAFMAAEQADVTSGEPGVHWLETVADQTDDIAGAAGPVADALTKYHDQVNAVMAYFDGAAEGAAQSLRAAGVHAVVVGQQGNSDGIAAIRAGTMDATINELPYEQALIALAMVTELVDGKTVPAVVHPPVQLVTKANLSSYVPWTTGLAEVASGKLVPPTTVTAHPTFG